MASSGGSILKEIFSHRNIQVLTFSAAMWAISTTLWRPYWSLYALELGATKEVLGLLSMIQASSILLFQLPGGVLADRFGRRRVIIWFSTFRVLTPILYFTANSWLTLIPGLISQALGSAYMPAYNAIMAESIPSARRGAGYGTYRMVTSIPRIFTTTLGGIILDQLGMIRGFRALFVWSAIVCSLVLFVRARYLTETLESRTLSKEKKTQENLSQLVREMPKVIWILVIVACLSSFAVRVSWPFLVVYATEVIGLTNTEWGLIMTIVGLISAVISMPGGILSDRRGRKPLILASRIIAPATTLGLTFTRNFVEVLLVRIVGGIGAGLGGGIWGTMGGPAWQALVADLIPSTRRGRVMGIMGTITGLIGAPAAWVGGFLWDNYTPEFTFWTSFIIGIAPIPILYVFVKEPKTRER